MFRTAALAETPTDWRQFDDRDARQDRIATELAGAAADPGF
jgi:hypothetical protein